MIEVQNDSLVSRSPETLFLGDFCRRELNGFEKRILDSHGAVELFERLCDDSALSVSFVRKLGEETPLPVLGKLVSLMFSAAQTCRIQPVFLMPFAEVTERCSRAELALAELDSLISSYDEQVTSEYPIAITLDRWHGKFRSEKLLEILSVFVETLGKRRNQYFLFGPSSRDLRRLQEAGDGLGLETVLFSLRELGISRIEGGVDSEVRSVATEVGFRISLGQEVVVEGAASGRASFSTQFIEDLLDVRNLGGAFQSVDTWFPLSRFPINRVLRDENPLALHMLKAVAIGRLVLNKTPFIRAPLSVFGLECAHLAAHFGANDLGFVALDQVTAHELGLVRHSDVSQVLDFSKAQVNLAARGVVK